jgi:hypothetical protein
MGAIQSEIEAAKYYDHIAIISQGVNAKTNFSYNTQDLYQIIKDYDTDSDISIAQSEYGDFKVVLNPDMLDQNKQIGAIRDQL